MYQALPRWLTETRRRGIMNPVLLDWRQLAVARLWLFGQGQASLLSPVIRGRDLGKLDPSPSVRSSLDNDDRGRNYTGSSISDLFWGESKYTSVWALPWKKERKDELNLCSHFIWTPQTACAEVCPTEHPVHGMWLMVLGEKKLPWTNKFWKYFLSTLLVYWNSQSLQYTFKCTMSLQE